ncbi:MAG TPA: glycosyl hydrolase family 28-related protein [Allosphingosinicella sp.]|jgi:hypothetical protein
MFSTQQNIVMSVSILSYIPSGQHAAIAARTSTYDASADFNAAIAAFPPEGGTLYIPAGKYRLNSMIDNKVNVCWLGDGPDASTLEWASTHTGHGIRQPLPVNGSTQANNIVEKIGLVSLAGGASTGGGYYDRGGTEVRIVNCRVEAFKYGIILDQSEIADVDMCDIFGSHHSCIWIVNGYESALGNVTTPGNIHASPGYTNRIAVKRCQLNGPGQYCILDDGGVAHSFIDNNLNGSYMAIRAAGVAELTIQGNYFEGAASTVIYFSNYSASDIGVGPCGGVLIAGNAIFPPGGNYCIQSASLSRLTLIGNLFGNSQNTSVAAVNCTEMSMVHSMGNETGSVGGMFQNAPYLVRWSAEALRDGSATADVGSIAPGASAFVNVTVPDAAVGDRIDFVSASVDLGDDITISGRVSAANTVRVKLTNTGAAAVDPTSCTYSARVEKKSL